MMSRIFYSSQCFGRLCLLVAFLSSLVFSCSPVHAQSTKVRVFVFAGQSNCNGAGGRVARYKANSQDWMTPYVFKMIQNVQQQSNNPVSEGNWQKRSYYTPQDLNGDGTLDYEIGTRLSHMRWPFHTLFDSENLPRLWHNVAGEYDKAVHPPVFPGMDPYPNAFNDNHGANNGFDGFVGSEIQFARRMRYSYPNDDVAIVKISAGSSSIANWEPAKRLWENIPAGTQRYNARKVFSRDGITKHPNTNINNTSTYLLFYHHLVPAVEHSMNTLEDEYGVGNVELAGFVWIQGENDLRHVDPTFRSPAYIAQKSTDYKNIFNRMVQVLRNRHNPIMPFTICLTKGFLDKDWINGQRSDRVSNLQAIQKQIGDSDPLGKWVYTDNLTIVSEIDEPNNVSDQVHWDSESLRVLGSRIFNKFEAIKNGQ